MKINCIIIPYDYCNPYQDELIVNLEKNDIIVEKEKDLKTLLKAINKQDKPDIIHLHWIGTSNGPLIIEILRTFLLYYRLARIVMHKIKVIWTIHNYIPHEVKYPLLESIKNKLVYSVVTECIIHSTEAKQLLISKWKIKKDKLNIISHGNYINSYPNIINKFEARNRLSIPKDKIVFSIIGNVRKYKGIEDAIKAFLDVATTEHFLLIAGRTYPVSYQDEIEKICKNKINIKYISEYISVDKMQVYMKSSDVALLTHNNSNLTSGAAVLAMSFALPCIVPDSIAFRSILDENGAVFFKANDTNELAKAMLFTIERRDLLSDMGKYNFKKAEKWNWEAIAEQTVALYNATLIH